MEDPGQFWWYAFWWFLFVNTMMVILWILSLYLWVIIYVLHLVIIWFRWILNINQTGSLLIMFAAIPKSVPVQNIKSRSLVLHHIRLGLSESCESHKVWSLTLIINFPHENGITSPEIGGEYCPFFAIFPVLGLAASSPVITRLHCWSSELQLMHGVLEAASEDGDSGIWRFRGFTAKGQKERKKSEDISFSVENQMI